MKTKNSTIAKLAAYTIAAYAFVWFVTPREHLLWGILFMSFLIIPRIVLYYDLWEGNKADDKKEPKVLFSLKWTKVITVLGAVIYFVGLLLETLFSLGIKVFDLANMRPSIRTAIGILGFGFIVSALLLGELPEHMTKKQGTKD